MTKMPLLGRMVPLLCVVLLAAGCEAADRIGGPTGEPAPPQNFDAYYYARAVHLAWELDTRWDGEVFRVYGKRVEDAEYFLLAEVTSCADGECGYRDRNISPDVSYEYYVAAVDSDTGSETASDVALEVYVPHPVPPEVPGGLDAVPLDGALYVTWDDRSRSDSDFSFYRVYLDDDGSSLLLGETDSEGFLDLLVENGNSYAYFVTAVDDQGHESEGSPGVVGTPRPDFSGELLHAHEARPDLAGFRFRESEELTPIVHGSSPDRHFRLEVDEEGWWLVPGPGSQVHRDPTFTTQLRCGPAADVGCIDLRVAPASDYTGEAIALVPEYSYVLRTPAEDGGWRYGVLRVTHVGWSQDGAIALFDWAYQLQVNNRALMPGGPHGGL